MARRLVASGVLVLMALAGSTSARASSPPTSEPPATSDVTQIVVGPECADRDGATVTQLPDVVVPAVTVAPVQSEDVEIGGDTVAGVTVDGFTIPEQTIDAGCVIEYDAPGGCLGAVEITGASIPAVTIPASVIPAVELPTGDVVSEQTIAEVVVPGVTADGARTEQVCQIEIEGELPTVSRAGVVREGFSRPGAARPGASRPARCVDDDCLPELQVEAVRIEPAALPDVDVNPGRLQSQDLRPDVEVLTGDGESAFVTPGDVLFDSDQAVVRPEAAEALGAVADQINATTAPGSPIRIEGHTDDRADDAYNLDLSRRRAQAVADWIGANGAIDPACITVVGLGESSPAYSNDSDESRARNRRVVITVEDA